MTISPNRRRETTLQFVFLLLFLAGAFGLLYAVGVFSPKVEGAKRVTFIVQGSATSSVITYTEADGSKTKPVTVGVPWRKVIDIPEGSEVYLTATNPSQSGNIECVLLLDGEDWKKQTATLPADKVACAGIVP